jgi:hypothetical protein
VLRYRWQAPCDNLEEMLLGIGFWQPPALNQVEVELLISLQQILFALGQGWHAVKLHRMTMGPNVAKSHPEHELGIRPCRNPPFVLCAARRQDGAAS